MARDRLRFAACIMAFAVFGANVAVADPLPSWRDTDTKDRIIAFVNSVTDPGAETYVTPDERIAVFDNDGTLWAEQPIYFQLLYALDRLQQKAEADPSILTTDVLRAASQGDVAALSEAGVEGLVEILNVSHAGMSVDDFQADVSAWLSETPHPSTGVPFGSMIYQPMLELLRYLRDEDFQTWIVSGGGVHFIRAFAEQAYGIPPQQVLGSAISSSYADGSGTIMKEPGIVFVDDGAGKPVGIDSRIGRRPIFAGGNSDGDFQMLEYTMMGDGARFALLIHHTDGEREFAYDSDTHAGRLVRGLEEGPARGWTIVDMAQDWHRVWPE